MLSRCGVGESETNGPRYKDMNGKEGEQRQEVRRVTELSCESGEKM